VLDWRVSSIVVNASKSCKHPSRRRASASVGQTNVSVVLPLVPIHTPWTRGDALFMQVATPLRGASAVGTTARIWNHSTGSAAFSMSLLRTTSCRVRSRSGDGCKHPSGADRVSARK
jgi:hypothetical protein